MALLNTATQEATTTLASIFGGTVPASTEYIITGMRVANQTASAHTFEVKVVPASGDDAWIASVDTPINTGQAIELVAGGYFKLGAGDDLQIKASSDTAVTIVVSYKSASV